MEKIILLDVPKSKADMCKYFLEQYAEGSGFHLLLTEYFPEDPKPGMITLNLCIPECNKLFNFIGLNVFIDDQLPVLVNQNQ